jgi:ABC-2 type transport system permease protein
VKGFLELAKVELKLFFREPISLVFTFALPLIFYPILGVVFGNVADRDLYHGFGAMDFYTPAYIGLVLAALGLIQLPVHLAGYRQRGVLRRFRASSLNISSILSSQAVVSIVIAIIGAILLITVGVAGYDVHAPESATLAIIGFFVGTLCFISVGFLLGALMPTPQAAQGAGLVLYILMMMLGGAGPPSEVLTPTLNTIGDFTPLKHVVTLIQGPWLGLGWNNSEFFILVGITVFATFLAVRLFKWE